MQRLRGDNESQADKYDRLQKELGKALAHFGAKDDHEAGVMTPNIRVLHPGGAEIKGR